MSAQVREGTARWLRVCAALLAIGATLSWITPRNVPGQNLVPFGCGAPSSPRTVELAGFVCSATLSSAKALSVALVVSAGLLLLASEVIVPKFWHRPWGRGLTVVAPVAVPLVAVSVVRLLSTVGTVGADGTLIRCGTAAVPARDAISRYVCGQLADTHRYLALGGVTIGVVLLIGAVYVAGAWGRGSGPGQSGGRDVDSDPAGTDRDAGEPGTGLGQAPGALVAMPDQALHTTAAREERA